MKKTLVLILAALCTLSAAAQTIPVNPKFGAVSDREIDMTVYEPDTSAVAVVLYRDYTLDLEFDFKLEIVQAITVHERIKVLKEAGKDYADYSFIYTYSDIRESYSGVKVETYNRENGKVVKTKMSKNYLFDEKFSDTARRLSFSAENVKVGSVIEVTWKFVTPQFWDIENIPMQEEIPINEIKVDVGYAEYFRMNRNQRGSVRTEFRKDSSVNSLNLGGGAVLSYNMNRDIYRAVDVPAMPDEPYSFCPEQYRTQVLYDLSGVYIPGAMDRSFNNTWEDVDKAIRESDIIGGCKAKFRDAKELETRLEGLEGDEARITAVRNYVTEKVKWDENSRLVPDSAKDVLKQGSGTDADINALTASALNTVGYVAEPVMVRRRSRGTLMTFHITMNAFTTFILRVSTADGSRSWYLDAAREEGYLNVLNPDFLVKQARLLPLNGTGQWVDLTQLTPNRITESVTMRMAEDGTLEGTANIKTVGEDTYSLKAQYDSFDTEDAFIEEVENDEGIEIESLTFQKDYAPQAELNYTFRKEQDRDERVYLHPFLSKFHSNTAFRKEKRDIPVDFSYPVNIIYNCLMDIPEGYVVEELPEDAVLTCPPVEGRLQFQCKVVGNRMSIQYRFSLNSILVLPEAYPDLRAFWETAAGIENSTIVLKKQ